MPNTAGSAKSTESPLFQGERGADGEDGPPVTTTFNKDLKWCPALIAFYFEAKMCLHVGFVFIRDLKEMQVNLALLDYLEFLEMMWVFFGIYIIDVWL